MPVVGGGPNGSHGCFGDSLIRDTRASNTIETMNRSPVALAGLSDRWKNPEGAEVVQTSTILTTTLKRDSKIQPECPILACREWPKWLGEQKTPAHQSPGIMRPIRRLTGVLGRSEIMPPSCLVSSPSRSDKGAIRRCGLAEGGGTRVTYPPWRSQNRNNATKD
jgi:putative SOS response-associated peptidase YedK